MLTVPALKDSALRKSRLLWLMAVWKQNIRHIFATFLAQCWYFVTFLAQKLVIVTFLAHRQVQVSLLCSTPCMFLFTKFLAHKEQGEYDSDKSSTLHLVITSNSSCDDGYWSSSVLRRSMIASDKDRDRCLRRSVVILGVRQIAPPTCDDPSTRAFPRVTRHHFAHSHRLRTPSPRSPVAADSSARCDADSF